MEEIGGNSFCCGALYGFIAAGIIALILTQMREARGRLGHKDRPLDKFPDSAHPNMTPLGLVKTSRQALTDIIMWSFLLSLIVGIVIAGLYYIYA
jgi:hypothetical protein